MPSEKTRVVSEAPRHQRPNRPVERLQTNQSTADADLQQPSNSTELSPDNLPLLHRTIGNQAVTRLLQASQTKRVNGKTVNTRIQRALIDGTTQSDWLWDFEPEKRNDAAFSHLFTSFANYAELMKKNTSNILGRDDQTKGERFYADVDKQLTEIGKTSRDFLEHKDHKRLDTEWFRTLIERDIPETRAAARWVQHSFASHLNSTYLNAITTAKDDRKTALMDYVRDQSVVSWDQMPDAQKQLLADNRDSDAARIAAIRGQAQKMMKEKRKPREVLAYLAREATKFVQDVVKEYVAVAGLEQTDLAVVSSGSFGSGEMFPYSDVDVQMMTTRDGDGAIGIEQMHLILHNIRMRVRIANMNEPNGEWKNTLGWDVDQLVGSTANPAFDPEAAVERDPNKGLAQSSLLYATTGGAQLAGDLKGRYTAQGKDAAKAKMDMDLYAAVRQGDWWMKKPDALDNGREPFEFKERFMRLPKIFLNVLAMYYGLRTENSWDRIDELVKDKILSPAFGADFKKYLDIVSEIRLKYQFFYQHEGLDTVSPTPDRVPLNQVLYPKGFYTLTEEDRTALRSAQQIQQDKLTKGVVKLRERMFNQ